MTSRKHTGRMLSSGTQIKTQTTSNMRNRDSRRSVKPMKSFLTITNVMSMTALVKMGFWEEAGLGDQDPTLILDTCSTSAVPMMSLGTSLGEKTLSLEMLCPSMLLPMQETGSGFTLHQQISLMVNKSLPKGLLRMDRNVWKLKRMGSLNLFILMVCLLTEPLGEHLSGTYQHLSLNIMMNLILMSTRCILQTECFLSEKGGATEQMMSPIWRTPVLICVMILLLTMSSRLKMTNPICLNSSSVLHINSTPYIGSKEDYVTALTKAH